MKRTFLFTALLLLALSCMPSTAHAEDYRWQINYQHVILDVNQSGHVYMMYEVDADIVKGTWYEVWIPATTGRMQVSSVVDGSNNSHSFVLDDNQVKIAGFNLKPGDHVNLKVYSTLPRFVYVADRQGYDIVSFTPPWWDMTIARANVTYALPGEIPTKEVYTGKREYSNIVVDQGRTIVQFWGRNLGSNQQFDTAVSFPDRYMAAGAVVSGDEPGGGAGGEVRAFIDDVVGSVCPMVGCISVFIVVVSVISIVASFARRSYTSPVVSMDGVGVNKFLDPVEAAMLLRVDPRRILTMIMFGLLKRGNMKLTSTDPVRLKVVSREKLNRYERLFVDAVKGDQLDESLLLVCFRDLARLVVDKTRPFCRKDTEDFYRQKIEEAWSDVKAVDTPELRLEKYDTNMFWLMADEAFAQKTRDNLRSPGWEGATVPPSYWWYPIFLGLPRGRDPTAAAGTAPPSSTRPSSAGGATNRTTTSVESFATAFSDRVESFAGGVVGGVEAFLGVRDAANAPPPAPAATSTRSSFACVSCACACAHCACACACAGGGGGCT